jgi:hypothetical protein
MKESLIRSGSGLVNVFLALLLCAGGSSLANAVGPGEGAHPDDVCHTSPPCKTDHARADDHGSLANVGAKLSNPVSDVWAMFTQFGITVSDGNLNENAGEIGGNMIFQPILPIPIYGSGDKEWRLITRPTIPILFGNPVPEGPNDFNATSGLGDITLPLPLSVPAGNWIVAAGPAFLFPTSTEDAFGRQQWGVGASAVFGYKTKKLVVGAFPQYYWGVGSRGNDQGATPDASFMSLLYFAFYNLPNAWQIGINPTVTYDAKASAHNKWNVPIGLVVAKTTKILNHPVKFQFGFEYSVLSQRDFGQRFQAKLNIIPVIAPLIKKPIFGGG